MLKMEIIKFDPQDVITTSVPVDPCICNNDCYFSPTSGAPNRWFHDGCRDNCTASVHTKAGN